MKTAFLLSLLAAFAFGQPENWSEPSPATSPSPRALSAMVYDSVHHLTVLFGGAANSTFYNDTWTWNGSNWTLLSPPTSPSSRAGHSMVFDSARGVIVMFGGSAPNIGSMNDTWIFDGTTWTLQNPQNNPPARSFQGMAFDTLHGQAVMFGGYSQSASSLGDTWTWNGENWTQGPSGPAARYGMMMSFDSVHNQTVLFGGATTTTVEGDTWLWNGTAWTQVSPQTVPSGRYYGGMAFDGALGEAILFGGWNAAQQNYFDTWAWNGTNWVLQSTATSPTAVHGPSMSYDSGNKQIVLIGGIDPSYFYSNTWLFQGGAPSISNVISASGFGAFTTAAPGSWIEIYGSGLAPDSRSWASTDFSGNTAPTSLDGVQVTIGGVNAVVSYISPTQVNAQLPATVAIGSQLLTVTNGTATSATYNITLKATDPGFLAPTSFVFSGNQYLVALHASNSSYVAAAGAVSGATPAQPGETIILYGVGFGPVLPAATSGQIVTATNQLSSNLQVLFGGVPAQITYDGLAPGFVGLYQFNVVVPQVASNNLTPVRFTLAGVPGTQTLYTAIQ